MNEAEILAMIKELNTIEVKGEGNMDTLLSIIRFLHVKADALKEQRLHPKENKDG